MWHSKADIINDLAALNDFGEPENTEPYKILCSIGRGSKGRKNPEPQPKTLLDPRTGEEVELDDDYPDVEDFLCRGKGRGSILSARNYSLLQKQLRLARPLGSGDEIIESFYKGNCSSEKVKASRNLPGIQSSNVTESSSASSPKSSVKMKARIKAVRSSNMLNNALIAGLLRAKQISVLDSGIDKSNAASKPKISDNQDYACDFQTGREVKNGIHQTDESRSDNSFSWENSEDATSESVYTSSKSSSREESFDKIKVMGDESSKSFCVDLSDDFNSYSSVSIEEEAEDDEQEEEEEEEEAEETCIRDILSYANTERALHRNEMYRKLGERMNVKMLAARRKMRENSCIIRSRGPVNKPPASRSLANLQSFKRELVYDEFNFPPLV